MDALYRTFRCDLSEQVTRDVISAFFTENEELFDHALIYHEFGDKTGKAHAQGYIKFKDRECMAVKWTKNKFAGFKHKYKLKGSVTSCVPIKKESYLIYTAKDKDVIVNIRVPDEVRLAREEQSFKKKDRALSPFEVVQSAIDQYSPEQKAHCSLDTVARNLLAAYAESRRKVYAATFKAEVVSLGLQAGVGHDIVLNYLGHR